MVIWTVRSVYQPMKCVSVLNELVRPGYVDIHVGYFLWLLMNDKLYLTLSTNVYLSVVFKWQLALCDVNLNMCT